MSEEIKPALTPEEWGRGAFPDGDGTSVDADAGIFTVEAHDPLPGGEWRLRARIDVQRRHAFAALALHGQPFGFTAEDVRTILACAEWDEQRAAKRLNDWTPKGRDALRHLAARMAALLPSD